MIWLFLRNKDSLNVSGNVNQTAWTEYRTKKEKLSMMVYSKTVICKLNEVGDCVDFISPEQNNNEIETKKTMEVNDSADSKEGLDVDLDQLELSPNTSNQVEGEESENDRFTRLSFALKFALEGNDFANAMRIAVEMDSDNATLPEVTKASENGSKIKSNPEFIIKLVQFMYKPKGQSLQNKLVSCKSKVQL